jgi:hypothetical protein
MRRLLFLIALAAAAVSPAAAQLFGGGGGGGDKITFALCQGVPCTIGTNIANPFIVTAKAKLKKCYIAAKIAPLGSALTLDVRVDGLSAFGAKPKLSLAAAATGPASVAEFDRPAALEYSIITVDIVAIGSTFAGQGITAVCTFK